MARGTLRIYLGAAPGVGKTVAMLDEGRRRLERGTDVVVAIAETHGRSHTAACLEVLPQLPRRHVTYRGATLSELDLAGVLARRPAVALVDELAHTNAPEPGANERRWHDVEAMLEAGIDVISTLNVQHLESLNDVVAEITGVPQRETVPDAFVRSAEQVELVDMTPEALRRRLAHGNVYPAERVDAALGNYFRAGNLTALRELALLWLAGSVEAGLQRYKAAHEIDRTWETKERILVALTGGPEGDTLIRRAARIASRSPGADLHAVHVARGDGLSSAGVALLAGQRALVESLGGTYHSVVGDRVPEALIDFARRLDATQIVLGASRRSWPSRALAGPGNGATVTRLSGAIDVHLVSHDYASGGMSLPRLTGGLTVQRRVTGAVVGAVLLAALTLIGTHARSAIAFAADVPLFLLVVVVTSLIGGFYPAVVAAVAAIALLNFYFVPPLHTFTIASSANIVALIVFLLVAALVSRVVDTAARRSVQAARAAAEAETLSAFAGSLLRGEGAAPSVLERVRETFGMDGAALFRRSEDGRGRDRVAGAGDAPQECEKADAVVQVDDELTLGLQGHVLPAADLRVLSALAAHVAVAYRQQVLADAAAAAAPLAETDRQRTALLSAVGHDLRTPIAAAKAAVGSLRLSGVEWTGPQRAELLATAEDALDRLTELVTNLLDLSRLQVSALPVVPARVGVEDVVARALDHADPGGSVVVDVPPDLPDVHADPGLLERVVANLVQNAVRHTVAGTVVRVAASAHRDTVQVRVIDRGPGITGEQADQVFRAFQRLGDTHPNGDGVGLGLAIARGFAEAMGGSVQVEPTPGGGATLVVTLLVAT